MIHILIMASIRNFIVVGSGRGLVLQVLLAIHTFTNANCVAVCAPGTRFMRLSRLCSRYLELDSSGKDDDRFVEVVNRFADTMPDLVLISADCDGARMTWRVRHRLQATVIPVSDPETIDCFNNKWCFYLFCKQHGLSVPATRFIEDKHNFHYYSTVSDLGTPFVVKPVDQDSAKGVQVISSAAEFQQNILNNEAYQYAPLIAQRYIEGVDVGLDVLSIKGKVAAIAIQQRDHPQHDEAGIKFISNHYLEDVAHTLSRECGYEGVMNIDARIEAGTGKVFLIECNPRFWRSLMASAWCGLNFVSESVERSVAPDQVRTLTSGSADTYYHPLFRPSLWRYGLFDRGHRGRIVRTMVFDLCILGASVKALLRTKTTPGYPAIAAVSPHADLSKP